MRNLKKAKLDEFDVRLLVPGLFRVRELYPADVLNTADDLILRLINEHETMKPR